MTPKDDAAHPSEPFRQGSSEQFAHVRELLLRSGYTETLLCERAEVPSIHYFPRGADRAVLRDIVDAQSLFVALFIDGAALESRVVRAILPARDFEAIEALGLLKAVPGNASTCMATVTLYPIEELFVASDRIDSGEAAARTAQPEHVESAVTAETHRFLQLLPRERRDEVLDLCSGAGLGALLAATFAKRSWAVDGSARATRFARFNAALNQLPNATALHGDLYAPVVGQTFDLIIAHPAYTPPFELERRNALDDGEGVLREILAGLPEHLRPGGQFFCDCLLGEQEAAPLEQRLRAMLGAHEDDFDIVIGQGPSLDPVHYYADLAREGQASFEQVSRWNRAFERLGVRELLSVALLVQRRDTPRQVVTSRRALSSLTSAADLQWVIRWLTATSDWDLPKLRRLLNSHPRMSPRTQLRSRSVLREGQWMVEECELVTLAPFAVEAACPNWYATLLMWCDGRMSAREHLQFLRDTHVVPDNAPEDAFASMIRQLVDNGLVEIEDFPLPDATVLREPGTLRERSTGSAPVERAD